MFDKGQGRNRIAIISPGNAKYTSFGIRPIAGGAIRPGDDIILTMAIRKPSDVGDTLFLETTPDESGYLAVYDKKMLWRANLYIDEKKNDWNSTHPWGIPASGGVSATSPQWWNPTDWGNNEWNREYAFTETGMSMVEAIKLGKQTLELHPFTWINDGSYGGTVAYSLNCHDSPFEFNVKMDHQKTVLDYRFHNHVAPYNKGKGFPIKYLYESWTSTLAPENRKVKNRPENDSRAWENYATGAAGASIQGITNYPYRPGYASSPIPYAAITAKPQAANAPIYIRHSAGVDCLGLVQRSMSYGGETYSLDSIGGYNWISTDLGSGIRSFPSVDNGQITKIESKNANNRYPGLTNVIPGDIVFYPGHVMMVASVEQSGIGDVRPEDVKIIEATNVNFTWNIHFASKNNTLQSYSTDDIMKRAWIIGRLK